ncbi:STAS domain-containing protein [Actinomadura pelletieri DSM 43383]|uniref:STAS domain-containing protein n=1 Tax=Actinomadura pelletieri DSM 43383 TaxID=1120940 RepID=A0A495QL39_9ACTN|nr:STAS domain-containing protein [Actinomadura pelletieri]RKS73216.1 STAS domain-containing protein [Actinomadura pelletieri DSM 43383]
MSDDAAPHAAPVPPMSIDMTIERGCIVVRLGGHLVVGNVPRLNRWLDRIGRLEGRVLVAMDLHGVVGCDCAGVDALVDGAGRIRKAGGLLIAAHYPDACEAFAGRAAAEVVLETRATVDEAIAELHARHF